MYRQSTMALVCGAVLACGSVTAAPIVIEDFEDGASGWVTVDRTAPEWVETGGHDGGAYISFLDDVVTNTSAFGSALIKFRCADGCSDNDFQGDWLEQGTFSLSWWMRHDADIALQSYIRIPRLPSNSPAASALPLGLIQPGEWTNIVLEIDPNNPEFTTFGGGSFEDIFSAVSRLQPGVFFDVGEVYSETNVRFDIDDVQLNPVPVPAAVWLFGSGLVGLFGWRKRAAR